MRALSLFTIVTLTACSPSDSQPEDSPIETNAQKASIDLEAKVIDDNNVQFVVNTSIPTPVVVMAGVSLKGQAPDDTYIGHSERITLDSPQSVFTIDTSKAREPLPSGEYEAEVSFYPGWGADNGNSSAKSAPELHAKSAISLNGAGTDRKEAERKNDLQRWVMGNLGMNEPWNRATYEEKLGQSQKGPSTMSRLHDAYYFPEADVTLIVNRLRNEVTIWRLGDVTE